MKKIVCLIIAMFMLFAAVGCSDDGGGGTATGEKALESGVLRVAMECNYAPYNWTQETDENGAVPIKGTREFAYGYDVMMAKLIAEKLGYELEIYKREWNSLPPAVMSGDVDCVIAGQSITADRLESVDFTSPYYYATIVVLVMADGEFAEAKGLEDLRGATGTSQIETVWYDVCLPQVPEVNQKTAIAEVPQMIVALRSGDVDFLVCDMPAAMGAVAAYSDLKILDFAGSGDDFEVSEEEINIGVSVKKGNKALLDEINSVLAALTVADFEDMMKQAIAVQPLSKE